MSHKSNDVGLVRNNYTITRADARSKSGQYRCTVWGRIAVAHECGVSAAQVPRHMDIGQEIVLAGYTVRRNDDRDRPSMCVHNCDISCLADGCWWQRRIESMNPPAPTCGCGKPGSWRGNPGAEAQLLQCVDCCAKVAVERAVERDRPPEPQRPFKVFDSDGQGHAGRLEDELAVTGARSLRQISAALREAGLRASSGVGSYTDCDVLRNELQERKTVIAQALRAQAEGHNLRSWGNNDFAFMAEAVAYLLERSK